MPADVRDHRERCAGELSLARLRAVAELLLAELDLTAVDLDVAVVDDERIRTLNRDYRGRDRATDVLAFSQSEGEEIVAGPLSAAEGQAVARHLGDVVISAQSAERQAGDGGFSLEQEVNRLLVHGLLHLLGYDHEVSAEEEARMHAEERRLAALLEAAGFGCAIEGST